MFMGAPIRCRRPRNLARADAIPRQRKPDHLPCPIGSTVRRRRDRSRPQRGPGGVRSGRVEVTSGPSYSLVVPVVVQAPLWRARLYVPDVWSRVLLFLMGDPLQHGLWGDSASTKFPEDAIETPGDRTAATGRVRRARLVRSREVESRCRRCGVSGCSGRRQQRGVNSTAAFKVMPMLAATDCGILSAKLLPHLPIRVSMAAPTRTRRGIAM